MNPYFPDWNIEAELPVPNHKKALGLGHELVELLWENGQIVLHNQTHRKHGHDTIDSSQVNKHDHSAIQAGGSPVNPSNLIQDDEPVSWIYCQVDDPFENGFSSEFSYEIPLSNPVEANKQIQPLDDNKLCKIDRPEINHLLPYNRHASFSANPLLPPRFQTINPSHQHGNLGGISKSATISSPVKADVGSSNRQFKGKETCNVSMGEVRECPSRTAGQSHCCGNQVFNVSDTSRASSSGIGKGLSAEVVKNQAGKVSSQSERGEQDTLEPTIASSSGRSGTSLARTCNQSTGNNSCRRKTRAAPDLWCQSEPAVLKSAMRNKLAQKSGTIRNSHAAEVHNLSERRMRDRINEKMRALQQLLPYSNKSDKASILDEAIEYMKLLQLQIQMMWIAGGMAPMMFPGVQHYMSCLGMGAGSPTMTSIHNPMHPLRMPVVDQARPVATPTPNQAAVCQTPKLNPINCQNQLQNPNFSEQYASYMGFHPQQSASQRSHKMAPPGNSNGPPVG